MPENKVKRARAPIGFLDLRAAVESVRRRLYSYGVPIWVLKRQKQISQDAPLLCARTMRYRTAAIKRHEQIRICAWRKKVNQIVEARKNQLSKLDPRFGDAGHEQVLSLQNHIATLEAAREENVQRKPDDVEQSQDLEKAARFVEKLDKWLKNATARRNNLLKILEFYCRPIDRRTEIPAAHYSELKQHELKQITASPFGPAASISGHVTTEDHPETVASAAE